MSKVSIATEKERKKNILSSLNSSKKEISGNIKGKKNIIVKPDLTSAENQMLSTHPETLAAILDFISELTDEPITIVGVVGIGDTKQAFERFGYREIISERKNVSLVDLKDEEVSGIEIYARDLSPVEVDIPNIVLESDFIISVAGLKTDDSVIASMGIKNLSGFLTSRPLNHNGYKAINLSLAKLAENLNLGLSILDGFYGIEGDGPSRGDSVEMRAAVTGTDFVSVDTVGAVLMGINPYKIGYLNYLDKEGAGTGKIGEIDIIGADPEKIKKEFRLHSRYEEQLNWQ